MRAARLLGRALPGALALPAAIALSTAITAGEARAEQPLRIDYDAHEGCPASASFLESLRARTHRARAAAPEEAGLDVWVRVTRRGSRSVGRVVLWKSSGARTREVESDDCRDVVSALALITALAVDPAAARSRPAASPAASQATSSPPQPPQQPPQQPLQEPPQGSPPQPTLQPAPSPAPAPAPPSAPVPVLTPAPLPWSVPVSTPVTLPSPQSVFQPFGPPWQRPPATATTPAPGPPPQRRWALGAQASVSFEATPRPLFGGGLFVERTWGDRWGVSGRAAIDLGATGPFDAGPGGVSFLRGAGHLGGCPHFRPASWLALALCADVEVGFLRGEGLLRGSLASTQIATVPWAAVGLFPRAAADLGGRVTLALEGGPAFPLVRRTFVFERPAYTIHEVPAVTAVLTLKGGIRF